MAEVTETKGTTTEEVTGAAGAGTTTPPEGGAGTGANEPEKTWEQREAELRKQWEKEADKRVTDAQKKWKAAQDEKERQAKMSEEERKQAEDEQRARENAVKEHELVVKGLRLDVVDAVAELGLDSGFRNLVAVEDLALISDEEERRAKLTERVKSMKALFDKEVKKQVEKEKSEFLKGQTPPASKGKSGDQTYSDYKKAGNVSGMIGSKLDRLFSGEQ